MLEKKFQMPTAYTILILIIIVAAIFTWIVPAGQYDLVDPTASKPEPIPGTYHVVESTPQGVWEILNAPVLGFTDGLDIALFVLVIGGFLGIIMKTGAINAGIAHIVERLKGRERLMIPILMVAFSLGGTSFGMAEETIAFYPLIIPVFIAAGYDSVTAVATILLGAGVGVLDSTVNPFATGVASGFANISIGDGIFFRGALLILQLAIAIIFVMRYADKVKKDPSKSLVANMREENENHFLAESRNATKEDLELTKKRKLVLGLFNLTFFIMVLGVIPWAYKFNVNIFENFNNAISKIPGIGDPVALGDWWFGEMTVLFLVSGILCGKVYGMKEKQIAAAFVAGAKDLLGVAIIVGLSRGITVVMDAGGMTQTILYWGEKSLAGLGKIPFIVFTYLFYLPLSFLIPSTSGLATLSMPIMAPLGDFAEVAKSLVVTAFQSASGIMNLITPTSAVVMGGLSIGRIDYPTWIKYVTPIWLLLLTTTALGLALGTLL